MPKQNNDSRFLAVLQRILPQTVSDPQVANATYERVLNEMRIFNALDSLQKFCEKGSLPDSEPATIEEFRSQLAGNFGEKNVKISLDEGCLSVTVEISLPDHVVTFSVKVSSEDSSGDPEAPYVSFPVALAGDPELVWLLARRENLGPDEADRALANIQEEFWVTKKGAKLLKEGAPKCFAEFIANISSTALAESGIKRYNKDPESLKLLRLLPTERPVARE